MLIGRLTVLTSVLCGLAFAPGARAAGLPEQPTWHSKQIHADVAHRAGYTGRGVVVAVLDGWIDTTHPDFGGRIRSGADCTSGTCTTVMSRDDCGAEHGTHVAGTVTSASFGVATRATLMPIRVLKADGKGECTGGPDAVAAGIRWAVAHGAQVLNLSLGPDVPGLAGSGAIPTAVHEAAVAGAVVVFSAGNSDLSSAQAYGDDALIVAATGPTGRLASYSQHGQGVSVAAPGGEPSSSHQCTQANCVTSLYPHDQYAVAAGTSMAAPHVAGLAALLIGAHPSWTAAQVRARITSTAHPLAGAGSGLVDAAAALGIRVTTPRRSPASSPAARVPIHPRATQSPKPVVVAPSVTASPSPAPTKDTTVVTAPSPVAGVVTLPTHDGSDPVPVPLAAVAGMLVGLAATAVVVARFSLR